MQIWHHVEVAITAPAETWLKKLREHIKTNWLTQTLFSGIYKINLIHLLLIANCRLPIAMHQPPTGIRTELLTAVQSTH